MKKTVSGIALSFLACGAALAAFPGLNGQIAFVSDRDGNQEIYVMNANGSGQANLSNNAARDYGPVWSPDGTRIAFTSDRDSTNIEEVYVMDADGSNQTNLTNNAASDQYPAWSPDGSQIAFRSTRDGNFDIYVMNANGSGQTGLTNDPASDRNPAWSPDGTRIAFTSGRAGNDEVYVMNANGSDQTNLSSNAANNDYEPDWQVATDTDGDGVANTLDNCTLIANPTQCDSDGDGYGNHCDGDLNNNSFTNAFDTPLYRAQLGQPSVGPLFNEADINCNGFVNAFDTPIFRSLLGSAPGPSGLVP